MLRLLIADGNGREDRAQHVTATGRTSAESYADVVHAYHPEAQCRLVSPADADAGLPEGAGLATYDGVIFTGSTLKVAERSPEVMRQRDLMQAALEAGLPVFGSCWGVQLAA
ncbi:type 1 glutamine amidotransferase, partial [Methylobacterium sp. WL122]